MSDPAYADGPCRVGLESAGKFYNTYSIPTSSPVSNLFFAPSNITFLQHQLELVLTKLVGEPVRVPVNDEFIQSMYDIYSQNSGLAYSGQQGLDSLNENFIEWEARIQLISIRQQKRYETMWIKNDRLLFFPYPTPTKTLKGETVIDTSGYMLTNPHRNNFGNYLQDVLHIGPTATPPCPANCLVVDQGCPSVRNAIAQGAPMTRT